jgi:N-acyl-D-amino-acid deacylase
MNDLLIKNAVLVDGSYAPAQRGDLLVKNGRITAVGGRIKESADEVIDADGYVLAPGFIDPTRSNHRTRRQLRNVA